MQTIDLHFGRYGCWMNFGIRWGIDLNLLVGLVLMSVCDTILPVNFWPADVGSCCQKNA
jgi:hypothetical protein